MTRQRAQHWCSSAESPLRTRLHARSIQVASNSSILPPYACLEQVFLLFKFLLQSIKIAIWWGLPHLLNIASVLTWKGNLIEDYAHDIKHDMRREIWHDGSLRLYLHDIRIIQRKVLFNMYDITTLKIDFKRTSCQNCQTEASTYDVHLAFGAFSAE